MWTIVVHAERQSAEQLFIPTRTKETGHEKGARMVSDRFRIGTFLVVSYGPTSM